MSPGVIAVVGSGFAGSLLARILAGQGHRVVLLERGTHPRFAIGESTTPLANLSLERIARRYGLDDCRDLAAHGRWIGRFPELRRGLKRGFTFYRHHPGKALAPTDAGWERLLVAASPTAHVADTHWLRADVDHHFVRQAAAAGVDYRDRVDLSGAQFDDDSVRLTGTHDGAPLELHAEFLIDASGPNGFLARQLGIPSRVDAMHTRSALVFSHFAGVRPMADLLPMPAGPYPDDWAAVHHIVDGGWMYSLRFDDGVTSAGFVLTPAGVAKAGLGERPDPAALWRTLVARYPTLHAAYGGAEALMPLAFIPRIQHRLAHAAGRRWVMLPHAYAFADPLFSTGIAWGLRAVERLALAFEQGRVPSAEQLARYDTLLAAEADRIDQLVAGAYHAMAHFELFAAQAMLYFAAVSYAETYQRITGAGSEVAWDGFLGAGDPVLDALPSTALERLRRITRDGASPGGAAERGAFVAWMREAIAGRNIGGFGDPRRGHLYPLDLDLLVEQHALLALTRDEVVARLPALRGQSS